MHRLMFCAALGLALSPLAATAGPTGKGLGTPGLELTKPDDKCHGTSFEFFDTPAEAAAQAKKDQKLVFVLHVSGNFEDPRFT